MAGLEKPRWSSALRHEYMKPPLERISWFMRMESAVAGRRLACATTISELLTWVGVGVGLRLRVGVGAGGALGLGLGLGWLGLEPG